VLQQFRDQNGGIQAWLEHLQHLASRAEILIFDEEEVFDSESISLRMKKRLSGN
jgi:hypothetical protein